MHNKPEAHIHIRAYYIWEAEGRPHGRHDAHWHQAEKEIYAEHKNPLPKAAPSKKAPPTAKVSTKKATPSKKPVAKKAAKKTKK
ncbi:MAG TPA: hypothetical protein DCW68_07360 [Rhodospirillaceae bacterium]|nr:MAG: hypothetical protein A2018_06870 [Alphaproteobacteria bacterium GWF2_58_20]HAU29904.1 hypothetical protein [Rhodospirillaceae bacterium]